MAHSKDHVKPKAHDLYVYSNFNKSEICDMCGITDKTLRDWADKGNWEEEKKQASITTPKIISALNQRLYDLSTEDDGKKMVDNADKIAKIAAAIEKLRGKELYLFNYIEVFQEFTDYLFSISNVEKSCTTDAGSKTVNGLESAKLLNLFMKDFINTKING